MGFKPKPKPKTDAPAYLGGLYLWNGERHVKMPVFCERATELPADVAPIPPTKIAQRVGPKEKHPWSKLEVGDSFIVAGRTRKTIVNLAFRAGKKYCRRFAVRKVKGEDFRPVFQVFRVEDPIPSPNQTKTQT